MANRDRSFERAAGARGSLSLFQQRPGPRGCNFPEIKMGDFKKMSFVRMLTIANERAIEQKKNEFFSQGFATAEAKVDHFGKRWMDVLQF